jgi:hypothetical protein
MKTLSCLFALAIAHELIVAVEAAENYGYCSSSVTMLLGVGLDTDYCDDPNRGEGSTQRFSACLSHNAGCPATYHFSYNTLLSACCVEHNRCLQRTATTECPENEISECTQDSCDIRLSNCALEVNRILSCVKNDERVQEYFQKSDIWFYRVVSIHETFRTIGPYWTPTGSPPGNGCDPNMRLVAAIAGHPEPSGGRLLSAEKDTPDNRRLLSHRGKGSRMARGLLFKWAAKTFVPGAEEAVENAGGSLDDPLNTLAGAVSPGAKKMVEDAGGSLDVSGSLEGAIGAVADAASPGLADSGVTSEDILGGVLSVADEVLPAGLGQDADTLSGQMTMAATIAAHAKGHHQGDKEFNPNGKDCATINQWYSKDIQEMRRTLSPSASPTAGAQASLWVDGDGYTAVGVYTIDAGACPANYEINSEGACKEAMTALGTSYVMWHDSGDENVNMPYKCSMPTPSQKKIWWNPKDTGLACGEGAPFYAPCVCALTNMWCGQDASDGLLKRTYVADLDACEAYCSSSHNSRFATAVTWADEATHGFGVDTNKGPRILCVCTSHCDNMRKFNSGDKIGAAVGVETVGAIPSPGYGSECTSGTVLGTTFIASDRDECMSTCLTGHSTTQALYSEFQQGTCSCYESCTSSPYAGTGTGDTAVVSSVHAGYTCGPSYTHDDSTIADEGVCKITCASNGATSVSFVRKNDGSGLTTCYCYSSCTPTEFISPGSIWTAKSFETGPAEQDPLAWVAQLLAQAAQEAAPDTAQEDAQAAQEAAPDTEATQTVRIEKKNMVIHPPPLLPPRQTPPPPKKNRTRSRPG